MIFLAHRGLPGPGRPENTAAAVAAAFDQGADGVEVDLRLTADGVLCLSHDDLAHPGSDVTLSGSEWPTLLTGAHRYGLELARLEQVLELAAGRRIVLELKDPGPAAETRTAEALVSLLAGVVAEVTVSSFSPSLAGRVRRLLGPRSTVRTALLGTEHEAAEWLLRTAVAGGHDEIHPQIATVLATPTLVESAHRAGLQVVPWTVNRLHEAQQADRLGVDALITDRPARLRAALVRTTV
jgi:glycerophosphoryl diester phosphodiesterase